MIVIPAYGRDYRTEAEALEAWNSGADFRIADISCPWDGSYVSKREITNEQVKIRFNKLRDFVFA
jgi:hypothetical protein